MAGNVGFACFNTATMLKAIRADDLNLNQPSRCPAGDLSPSQPAFEDGVHAIHNNATTELEVGFRNGICDHIPSRANIDGRAHTDNGLLDCVDAQVHGVELTCDST